MNGQSINSITPNTLYLIKSPKEALIGLTSKSRYDLCFTPTPVKYLYGLIHVAWLNTYPFSVTAIGFTQKEVPYVQRVSEKPSRYKKDLGDNPTITKLYRSDLPAYLDWHTTSLFHQILKG